MTDKTAPFERNSGNSRANRAVVPMIGKVLEAAIVVLFIGVMTTALYGGVVPDYRGEAAEEIADRTVVAAGNGVEGAIPPAAADVSAETTVDLPTAIHGTNYRIVASENALRLDHPHPSVGGDVALALPDHVVQIEGTWRSGARTVVVVEPTPENGGGSDVTVVVRLVNR